MSPVQLNAPSNSEASPPSAAPTGLEGDDPSDSKVKLHKLTVSTRDGLVDEDGSAKFARTSAVCLLLAGVWCVAFVSYALWQAAALVARATATTDPRPAAGAAGPSALALLAAPLAAPFPSRDSTLMVAAAVSVEASLSRQLQDPATSFESSAEASEKAVPVGLEATLEEADKALPLGEVPPSAISRPACEDVFVYIVSIAEGEPTLSAASLGLGKTGPARFRQPGQRLGDWTLLAISDDWTGLEPSVWLERKGEVCKARLAGNPARVHVPLKPPAPQAKPRPRKRRRR